MKLFLTFLTFAILQVTFSERDFGKLTTEEEDSTKLDVAKEFHSAEAKPDKETDNKQETPSTKRRRLLVCRPISNNVLRTILIRRTTALRSLGVRLVTVPRSMRRRLRRFGRVKIRRRQRYRPSHELCKERQGVVTYTSANTANANIAYMTQGVECAESSCRFRLSTQLSLTVSGRCYLRKTRIVVPVYNGCGISSKTIEIGCSCKCRSYNPFGR